MKTLKESGGALALERYNLVLVSGAAAARQRLTEKLRLLRGEYRYDTTQGVDYVGRVNVKNPDLLQISGLLKAVIGEDPEVGEITVFELTLDPLARSLDVSFTVKLIDGVDVTVEDLAI